MATNKTVPNEQNVEEFLNAIEDQQKRKDSVTLVEMMADVTGLQPVMWGSSIVGFGKYHYKYDSGREGDTMVVGFSPRKQNLTLYLGNFEQHADLLNNLGKHTLGKGCLYIKRLSDVDMPTLKNLVGASFKEKQASE